MERLILEALVVRKVDYRDSDCMVTLYTPDHGFVEVVARHCRSLRSPLMSAVELFCSGEYTLQEKGGRLTMIACEVRDHFAPLREDYQRMLHAIYYLQLLKGTIPAGQSLPGVYLLLLKALAHVCYSALPPELVTAAFEMRLMPMVGYLPTTDRCVVCGGALGEGQGFRSGLGGMVCARCRGNAPRISEGARRIIHKAPVSGINTVPLLADHPDWPEAAALYRPFVLARVELYGHEAPPLWTGEEGQSV